MPRRSDAELLAALHTRVERLRQRHRVLGLGVATAALLLTATGVAFAGNGGSTPPAAHNDVAAPAPTTTEVSTPTTLAEGVTTTTQPPAPTTTSPPISAAPTTTAAPTRTPSTTAPTVATGTPVGVHAVISQVWPPNRDATRVYISARGSTTNGYVSRLTLTWGDGTPAKTSVYGPTACQSGASNPDDVEVVNDNHAYAAAGRYDVQVVVVSTSCDGKTSQNAIAEGSVNYPPSPSPS